MFQHSVFYCIRCAQTPTQRPQGAPNNALARCNPNTATSNNRQIPANSPYMGPKFRIWYPLQGPGMYHTMAIWRLCDKDTPQHTAAPPNNDIATLRGPWPPFHGLPGGPWSLRQMAEASVLDRQCLCKAPKTIAICLDFRPLFQVL